MWRGLTDCFAWALVAGAAVCTAGPAAQATANPYAYGFKPLPGPGDQVKPHPAIEARYSAAYRACQDDPHATTYSLDMCDQTEMKLQDDALNRQWTKILAQLTPARIGGLREAERAWIKARAAHCNAAADQYAGGTIMPLIYGSCYIDETIRRTIWLEKFR